MTTSDLPQNTSQLPTPAQQFVTSISTPRIFTVRISYSGIVLECVQSELDRTPVMDDTGVDYLYTQVSVRCIALVNSDQVAEALRTGGINETIGTSYGQDFSNVDLSTHPATIGKPTTVVQTPNSTTIITDRAVRHWLQVPRRRLIIENENPASPQVLLYSPKDGYFVDARNGPHPEVFDIREVHGDGKTFLVGFSCKTYVNECENADGRAAALLSNRYSQTHSYDQDNFLSITTQGEARFRTDAVYNKINPDVLRQYMFNPIPNGFKRTILYVESFPDATGFRYAYADEQQHQQLVVGNEVGATRVEATYRQSILTNEDALGTVLDRVERAVYIPASSKKKKRPRKKSSDD